MSQVSPECARLWQVASPLHLPVKVSKGQPGKSTSCPRQGRMEARNHRREIMAQLGQYYDVIWIHMMYITWACEQCGSVVPNWWLILQGPRNEVDILNLFETTQFKGNEQRLCYCAFGCQHSVGSGNRWIWRMSCAKVTKQLALSHHTEVWPSKEKDPENWEGSPVPVFQHG